MIITRTPLRISFSGGGSDLEAYYAQEPGLVLSSAVSKYVYITVKPRFGGTFRVSYSRTETVPTADCIEHPIVRECLNALEIKQGLEIVSIGDLPAQSGMGSSSSFTVGLLHALHAFRGDVCSAQQLAEEACRIEIDVLREPIGKQDQYIAAHGGLQVIQFLPDGAVFVDPVICKPETRRELNRRLLLLFTGITRSAHDVLIKQQAATNSKLDALRKLCAIALELREVLTVGKDLNAFGRLLHTAWEVKRTLEATVTNPRIDEYYDRALAGGAMGGKLLGAGNGGFLLLFCEPHLRERVRSRLSELEEVPFALEREGSKVIYVGQETW